VAFSQVASPAQAQAASPPPSPPPPSPPLSTTLAIDRELIARWYLRVDAAWSRSLSTTPPPTAQQIAEANKTFDRASLAFFRLAIPEAIGILRDLEQSLSSKPPIESTLLSLQIEPRIWNSIAGDAPSQTLPSITLTTLQTPTSDATLTGDLTLISYTDSQEVLPTTFSTTTTLTLELKAGTQSTLNLSDYKYFAPFFENRKASKPARIEVTFTPKSGSPVSDWLIIPSDSFPSQRKANQIALDEAKQNISPLTYSLFKSRNNLLTNRPSRNNSSQFLARYETLENELQKELTSIKQGQSPYPLRDRWFASFQSGSASIPLWIQAPHVPATNKQFPAPLLILLHGAGGDESMFFFGYGQGIYPKLGVEAGMVVVAPNTTQMLTLPNAFDDLLKMLEELYSIDRSRIYLVGHSMGAAAQYPSSTPLRHHRRPRMSRWWTNQSPKTHSTRTLHRGQSRSNHPHQSHQAGPRQSLRCGPAHHPHRKT